jgi:hypothetical protein
MRNFSIEFLIDLLESDLHCGMINTAPTRWAKILLLYFVISLAKTFFITENPPLGKK